MGGLGLFLAMGLTGLYNLEPTNFICICLTFTMCENEAIMFIHLLKLLLKSLESDNNSGPTKYYFLEPHPHITQILQVLRF